VSMYIAAGASLNNLSRSATAPTVSPAADTNYPVTNLYDLMAAAAFRWGSITASPYVIFDQNIVLNGGY